MKLQAHPQWAVRKRNGMECDTCVNYEYDEEADEYYCTADMDEDDYSLLMQDRPGARGCPYWQADDEYAVVAHQAFAQGPNPDRKDTRRSPERRYHRVRPSAEYGGREPGAAPIRKGN